MEGKMNTSKTQSLYGTNLFLIGVLLLQAVIGIEKERAFVRQDEE